MTLKTPMVFLSLFFSISSFAGSHVTCFLRSMNNRSINATLPLTAVNGSGVESSGSGLNLGNENHSFMMELSMEKGQHVLQVMFFENNFVMDEVGNVSCRFTPKPGAPVICEKPVFSDAGKLIAKFSCINN